MLDFQDNMYIIIKLDNHFNESVEYYLKKADAQIQAIIDQCERDFQSSLTGKLPEVKVVVPASLTQERLI